MGALAAWGATDGHCDAPAADRDRRVPAHSAPRPRGRAATRELGRPASTVSREVSRHGGRSAYRAVSADRAAWERAERPKRCKLVQHPELCRVVATKLEAKWAPQQIAGWLKRQHPLDPTWSVSHETIYRTLFVQARGVLKRERLTHLPPRAGSVIVAPNRPTAGDRSRRRCPFASVPRTSRIAPCRATGKAT